MRRIAHAIIAGLLILDLTSCASALRHEYAQPTAAWQTRIGQLLYRSPKVTLTGDVFVRFSQAGDFQLTFSKAGVTVLTLRQDTQFAEMKGGLGERTWAGPVDRAPKELRGWLGLRDAIIPAQDRHVIRHVAGRETFLFRF